MTRRPHRNRHNQPKDHKKIFFLIGFLAVLVVLGVSSGGAVFFKGKIQKKPKAQGAVGYCRDNPVTPLSGYKWVANCGENGKCRNNDGCPKKTNDGYVNPDTSNWCYGFAEIGRASCRERV